MKYAQTKTCRVYPFTIFHIIRRQNVGFSERAVSSAFIVGLQLYHRRSEMAYHTVIPTLSALDGQ